MTAIKIFLIILLINILNIDNELTKESKENLMNSDKYEIATFGEGCFWCSEAIFQRVRGVLKVESGYSGGSVPNPTYEAVCTGKTGHAEVVQITFDPKIITFQELLEIFFSTHDPTTLNRQGADVGTQYRSVIFIIMKNRKKLLKR